MTTPYSPDFLKGVMGGAGDSGVPEVEPQYSTDFLSGAMAGSEIPGASDSDPLLRASIAEAQDVQPEPFARAKQLAQRYGLPIGVVESDMPRFEGLAAADDAEQLWRHSPAVAAKLTDPTFAKLSRDDIEGLVALEKQLGPLASAEPIQGAKPDIGSITRGLLAEIPNSLRTTHQSIRSQFADFFGFDAMSQSAQDEASKLRTEQAIATPAFESTLTSGVYSGVTSFIRNLPGLAASILTGNPSFALAQAGLQTEAEAYTRYRERGATGGEAFTGAVGEGAVEVITEKIPISFLVDKFGKTGAREFLIGTLLREVPGEQAATFAQDAIDTAIANPNKTWQDFKDERFGAQFETLIATLTQAGLSGSINGAATRMHNKARQADAAIKHRDALGQVMSIAANSRLRARDAFVFKDLVSDIADKDANVFIDGAVLFQSLEAAGEGTEEILDRMPTVQAQLDEAVPTNNLVTVPVSELVDATAGTPLGEALLPHLRQSEDAPSAAESETYFQREAQEIQEEGERVMAEQSNNNAFVDGAVKVENQIFDALEATGRFTPDVNKVYATFARNLYATMAERAGTTPDELMQRYPINVVSENLVTGALEQPGTDAFTAWFGNSITVDEKGAPQVLYHGTRESFDTFDPQRNPDEPGVFLTADPAFASFFAHGAGQDPSGGNIIPVYASIKNPLEVDYQGQTFPYDTDQIGQLIDAARDQGHDGVVLRNVREGESDPMDQFIALEASQLKSAISNDGNFNPNDPNILHQGKRGGFDPSTNTIALLSNADLSTFLHELGHLQLEMMADLASLPNAPEQIKADMDTLLKWFGVDDIDTWNAMSLEDKRPHHEQLAFNFEIYLFEGKAPSEELHQVFARIRRWMIQVYKSIRDQMNVAYAKEFGKPLIPLTPEVTEVFDRMLASEQAIREAERFNEIDALFTTRDQFPGDDAAWNEYQQLAREAHVEAVDALEGRSVRDLRWATRLRLSALKEFEQDAADKREAVRQEVEAEVASEPVYEAIAFLRNGELPESYSARLNSAEKRKLTVAGQGSTKLDIDALRAAYGDESVENWKRLPTGRGGLVGKHGIDPELAAKLLGFRNGDHMIHEIVNAAPLDQRIEDRTDQRMLQRYGDLSSPAAIESAVTEAIHKSVRTRMVAAELSALEKGSGETKRPIQRALKRLVRETLGRRRIGAIRPKSHEAQERRAGREARQAQKRGQMDEALAAVRQKMWHHLAAIESRAAEKEVERGLKFLRKFNKKSDALPADYYEQITDLLARFDLRVSTTARQAQDSANLVKWLDEIEAETGVRPVVDPALERDASRKPYRQMTLDEFRGLLESVKSIDHTGRLEQKLLNERDKRTLNAAAAEAKASADANAPRTKTERREHIRWSARAGKAKDIAIAAHRKAASLWREQDGFKDNGVWWNLFNKGMNAAADNETARMMAASDQLHKLFAPIMEGTTVWALNRPKLVEGAIDKNGQPVYLSRQARLMTVANMGNEVNWQRKRDGEGFTDDTMRAILNSMSKTDLDFVQSLWDFMDTFKSELGTLEQDTRGVAPKWVEATPLDTPHGTYRGGYMPIMYDANRDVRAAAFDSIIDLEAMMAGARGRQTTPHAFTEARAKGDIVRPVRHDFGVIFSHVSAVTHRLAWERWLYDSKRLLNHPDIKVAIQSHLGVESANTINAMMTDIALGRSPRSNNFLEPYIEAFANNLSVATMGWKMITAVIQPAGISQSITRLGGSKDGGYKWVGAGLREFYGSNWRDSLRDIHAKSEFMRGRALNLNHSIRELRQQLDLPGPVAKTKATFFAPMVLMQTSVDAPTWLGAYTKAVASKTEGGLELDEDGAVAFADQVVRDSQGSGAISDLAGVQRGPGFLAPFTRFYNYMSTTFQLNAEILGRDKDGFEDYMHAVHDLIMTNIIPAFLTLGIHALATGDDGDDDKTSLEALLREIGSFMLGQMVGLREFSGLALGYEYRGPTAYRAVRDTGELVNEISEGELDRDLLKALINVLGYGTGIIPASQVNTTIDGVAALFSGETDRPTAPVFGPPR